MDLELKNKSAIVLAASKGLGKAAAESLAKEGCKVAICSREEEQISRAASEIGKVSDNEIYFESIDVAKHEQLTEFIAHVEKKWSGVDILVTNAGGPPVKNFDQTTDEEWHYWYDITFMSVVSAVRAVLPSMRKKRWGRIINITSVSVKAPVENLIYSNSLRLAVVGLAKTLSAELGSDGITVNNVAPGYHLTDGLERIISNKVEAGAVRDEILNQWEQKIPLGRIGAPKDLAGLITFLASEQAGYLTGTTIQVDGGLFSGAM